LNKFLKKIITSVIKKDKLIYNFLAKSNFIFKSALKNKSLLFSLRLIKILFRSEKLLQHVSYKIIQYKYDYEKRYNFTFDDWFSSNIPVWKYYFNKYNLMDQKINYLEIGCFEGRSSVFILESFKQSNATLVDPFISNEINLDFLKIENNFIKNISSFKERVKKKKMTSDQFFKNNFQKYDLIYVDGAHDFESVKKDCQNSFNFLNQNGIMIFDDFLYFLHKKNINQNVIGAVLPFLRENYNKIKILHLNTQVIIKKL
jgi:hypothetical protein